MQGSIPRRDPPHVGQIAPQRDRWRLDGGHSSRTPNQSAYETPSCCCLDSILSIFVVRHQLDPVRGVHGLLSASRLGQLGPSWNSSAPSVIISSRGMAALERASTAVTTSPYFRKGQGEDEPLSDDELPSIMDILRPQPVHKPELIDLTLYPSGEVSM